MVLSIRATRPNAHSYRKVIFGLRVEVFGVGSVVVVMHDRPVPHVTNEMGIEGESVGD